MRAYATISPMFWIRGSGKELRGDPSAQLVALYLMTCSAAEMIGIYHVHPEMIARETGLSLDQVHSGLERCAEVDVAHYDDDTELVWVPALAKWQVGESLGAGKNGKPDRRIAGIVRSLMPYKGHRFYDAFIAKYGHAYSLHTLGGLNESPNKPLRSRLEAAANRENTFCRDYVPAPDLVPDPEGGAGGADQPFAMPPDWSPVDRLSGLLMTSKVPKWAIPEMLPRFVAHFAASGETRTEREWLQSASRWLIRDWDDPKRRPVKGASDQPHKPRTAAEALKAVGL